MLLHIQFCAGMCQLVSGSIVDFSQICTLSLRNEQYTIFVHFEERMMKFDAKSSNEIQNFNKTAGFKRNS